ncbi:MAG TPA: hypothetical protein VKU41_30120 [Polyangiaceae bacterium]|nr:hypothetical protein [Polyangiaceae bacterium]
MTRSSARHAPRTLTALTVALGLAACGSPSKDPPDAAVSVAYPAPHTPLPRVVSGQGPVMTAPTIVPLTFAGDPLADTIAAFVAGIAGSDYWPQATAQYGVGLLSSTPPISMSVMPAAMWTDGDVQAWLTSALSNTPAIPRPDPNKIYAIFLPDGTTVTTTSGTSCQSFGAYHDDFALQAGTFVTYVVVPRCPAPVPSVSDADEMTASASHEIIEAATDPLPRDHPAFSQADSSGRAWELASGGEVGDLCAGFPGVWVRPPGVGALVQRVWSNDAAEKSHDPCEPMGLSPYFNAAPILPDTVNVSDAFGSNVTTKGVRIPTGQTKSIELDLFSDAPTTGPWALTVFDATSVLGGGQPVLSFTLDHDHGQNGDKVQLSITAIAPAPSGTAPFWIQNDLNHKTTYWIGVVAN